MIAERIPEIQRLSREERLVLASELWEGAIEPSGEVEPDPLVIAELDRRMAEHHANPERAVPWRDALERIRASRK